MRSGGGFRRAAPVISLSHLDLAALEALVDDVGEVEHDALQEEHEGHPLVVGLDLDVVGPGLLFSAAMR